MKRKTTFKFTSKMDDFLKDSLAFAEQFPCIKCKTMSKKVEDKTFYCSKCSVNFKIKPTYVNDDNSLDVQSKSI